jgi:hypothetical protein
MFLVTLHELAQLTMDNFAARNQCPSHVLLHPSKVESNLSHLLVTKIRIQEGKRLALGLRTKLAIKIYQISGHLPPQLSWLETGVVVL